jgi:hypothetical protein
MHICTCICVYMHISLYICTCTFINIAEPSLHGKSDGSVANSISNKMIICVGKVEGLHSDVCTRDLRVGCTNAVMNNPGKWLFYDWYSFGS